MTNGLINYEPEFNFDDLKIVIKNGSPELVNEIKAVRQWIVKFCNTEKDAYPIYEYTGFGTRLKKLFGNKNIIAGYKNAEIERDFKEGLPLCPAISEVTDFELSKNGKILSIKLEVRLINGELLDIDIEKIYVIGG